MRKISKGLSVFMVVLSVLVSSFFMSFESAAMSVYQVSMGQPSVSDYSGYIEMLFENNSTGNEIVYVYFWNTTPHSWDSFPSVEISYSGSMLTFIPFGASTLNLLYTASDGVNSPVVVHNGEVSDAVHQNFSGYTLKAYHVYGNYSSLSISLGSYYGGNDFSVEYGQPLEYQVIMNMYNQIVSLNSDMNNKFSEVITLLGDYIYVHLYSMDFNIKEVLALLNEYVPKMDLKLQTIVDNTKKLVEQSAEDKNATDKFEEDSSTQSNKINDLNKENKVDKTDVDSASGSVDEYIDGDSIASYGTLLSVFTGNQYILRMILIVFAIGLISYVLFGKR